MATSHPRHNPRRLGGKEAAPGAQPDAAGTTNETTGRAGAARVAPLARRSAATVHARIGTPPVAGSAPYGDDRAAQEARRRARLAAMAAPRDSDDEQLAALRAVLRNEALMSQVVAEVDTWPEPTEEQRDTIAALFRPPPRH